MIYIIKQEGLYQNKVNSFVPVTVKWPIVLGHQHGGGDVIWKGGGGHVLFAFGR